LKLNGRKKDTVEQNNTEIILSDQELRKLQLDLLEMLIEVDRICRKYQIAYSLDGGSLLGAVRHGGFIPWDDDVDVIMRRKEYQRFYKACKRELDQKRFTLQEYRTDKNYRWGYAKLRRKGTEFVRLGQEHMQSTRGIFLDIFVVDNVPDGYILRRLHYMACYVIRKLLYSELGMKEASSGLKRKWFGCLYRVVPRDTIFSWRNRIAGRCNRKRTTLVSHMTYPYPHGKYGMPAECFDEMMDMQFEGYSFRVFKEYDNYLRELYGDYRKLPPKEERKAHLSVSKIQLLEPEDIFSKEELNRLGYYVREENK